MNRIGSTHPGHPPVLLEALPQPKVARGAQPSPGMVALSGVAMGALLMVPDPPKLWSWCSSVQLLTAECSAHLPGHAASSIGSPKELAVEILAWQSSALWERCQEMGRERQG